MLALLESFVVDLEYEDELDDELEDEVLEDIECDDWVLPSTDLSGLKVA